MPTTSEIHGHEVLHLVHDADPPLTPGQLRDQVVKRFGAEARFCTCSASGMTYDQLLEFLAARGKISEERGHIVPGRSGMCSGDGDHDHDHSA